MIFKHIKCEQEMLEFGAELAQLTKAPMVIYLQGKLGAGKTTFSRGFLQGFGHAEKVKSPTYTLVELYSFQGFDVVHFDLYRIHDAEELELMGIRDYFDEDVIALIEWPELALASLPHADIVLEFVIHGDERKVTLHADSKKGKKVLKDLTDAKGV